MNEFEGIENMSRSGACATKSCYTAMQILKDNSEGLSSKKLIEFISTRVEFDDWEKETYESTGQTRWKTIFYFYSIDLEKAGFIIKQKGTWFNTPEGEEVIKKGAVKLMELAREKYKEWDQNRECNQGNTNTVTDKPCDPENEEELFDPGVLQKANLEQFEGNALEGIKEYISTKNPYEFQDIVATMLRAMGYYTPYISPKGKDGGLDIVAYKDPLGADTPRIKVQVKHKPNSSISVPDIRSLVGLLNKEGDVGLFVTSGIFTSESQRFARDSHIHVKLIDIDHFIELWIEFYSNMTDEDKIQLPIKAIYYLGTNE